MMTGKNREWHFISSQLADKEYRISTDWKDVQFANPTFTHLLSPALQIYHFYWLQFRMCVFCEYSFFVNFLSGFSSDLNAISPTTFASKRHRMSAQMEFQS